MMDNKVLCVQLVPDPVQPVGVTGCDAAHCRRQMFTNNKQQQEDLQHLAAHVLCGRVGGWSSGRRMV